MHVLVGHINMTNTHLESVIRWNFMKVLVLLQHGVLASKIKTQRHFRRWLWYKVALCSLFPGSSTLIVNARFLLGNLELLGCRRAGAQFAPRQYQIAAKHPHRCFLAGRELPGAVPCSYVFVMHILYSRDSLFAGRFIVRLLQWGNSRESGNA